jgi:hypothetical protein
MYYIVKQGEVLNTVADRRTFLLRAAKEVADHLHKTTGDHYHVIKVKTVWATTTMDDLLSEKA